MSDSPEQTATEHSPAAKRPQPRQDQGQGQREDKGTARWREITDFLRSDLRDGHYQPGQALPGETDLAKLYATSRPTVRKAIAQLTAEGLLSASHGRGTFVRPRPDRRLILTGQDDAHLDLLSPAYNLLASGWEPVTVPSDAGRADPAAAHGFPMFNSCGVEEAEILGVRRGHPVIYRYTFWEHAWTRARIYIESNIPAGYLGTVGGQGIDRRFDPDVEPADYFRHLSDTRGPIHWVTTVHATMPAGDMNEDLNMEPTGTPLLAIRRIMLSADDRPLEYTQVLAPADRFEAANVHDTANTGLETGYTALSL
ncbi:phosphonate metabolism transcriptional regulator PhnF [Actinomadura vinacea]|uniref:Phosphonate metabolism transcriptional regulator PhnF n=1 Tax=Actinomadura vinacea TaxID=115336 RepID=A0ABN3JZ58_9ACTN